MKKIIIACLLVSGLFTSCVTYSVTESPVDVSDYCTGTYIATMSLHQQLDGSLTMKAPEKDKMTIYHALLSARAKYGQDVTVTNFQWDTKTTASLFGIKVRKVGMTYDVIRCE